MRYIARRYFVIVIIWPVSASTTLTRGVVGSIWELHVGLVILDPAVLLVIYEEKLDEGDVRPFLLARDFLPVDAVHSRRLMRADGLRVAGFPP